MDSLGVIITIGVVVAFVVQALLGFVAEEQWVHLILPILWLIAGIVVLSATPIEMPRDIIMLVIGFFLLIVIAGKGEDLRKRRNKES